MCIQMALQLATTAAGVIGESLAAGGQNQLYQQNAINANQAAGEKYSQLQARLIQEASKATEDRLILNRERMNAQGTALAGSQNGGTSEGQVMTDLARQASRQAAVVDTNLKYKQQQYRAEVDGIHAENEGRINSVAKGGQPNILSAIITGLGTVAGADAKGTPTYTFGSGGENFDEPLSPIDPRNMKG